jgi:hypothetical protein
LTREGGYSREGEAAIMSQKFGWMPLPGWLDATLRRAFALERPWLRCLRFPLGMSLIAVARRAEAAGVGLEHAARGPQR